MIVAPLGMTTSGTYGTMKRKLSQSLDPYVVAVIPIPRVAEGPTVLLTSGRLLMLRTTSTQTVVSVRLWLIRATRLLGRGQSAPL
jgi:hypothetical protein